MKVIITLTTVPSRLNSESHNHDIRRCIESLVNQDYVGDYEVHFNIPIRNHKTQELYVVPDWLRTLSITNPKLKLFEGLEDKGTLTKLFYTLQRESDPNSIIVVCDDDLVYHPKMLQEHVKNQGLHTNTAIGYDGLRAERETPEDVARLRGDKRDHYVVSVTHNIFVNVLQHYKTVSYKRSYFGEDFFKFINLGSWNDDITVSAYLTKNQIKKMVAVYEFEKQLHSLEDWQTFGGVTTFPVLAHTRHDSNEGCNLYRQERVDDGHMKFYQLGYLK